MVFAGWAGRLGSLIVAVNIVGSLFYGSLLGCFVLAFVFRRVRGTATFLGMLAGEAAILATAWFTDVSWLWYNVIGCVVVVAVALTLLTLCPPRLPPHQVPSQRNSAGHGDPDQVLVDVLLHRLPALAQEISQRQERAHPEQPRRCRRTARTGGIPLRSCRRHKP